MVELRVFRAKLVPHSGSIADEILLQEQQLVFFRRVYDGILL